MLVWAKRNENKQSVSFNVAPACRTASVIGSNATLKHMVNGMELLYPSEVFDPPAASVLMALLLTSDMVEEEKFFNSSSEKSISCPAPTRPIEISRSGCFHGGACRVGFNVEKSKAPAAGIYSYGRWMAS